jgi:hypothetical protein
VSATEETMRVERMRWDDYFAWLRRNVKAGEHGVIIGFTGSGKSVLAGNVVPLFGRDIVAFDNKGGDDAEVSNWRGFKQVSTWPVPMQPGIMDQIMGRRPKPRRYILAPRKDRMSDLPKARSVFSNALDDLFTRKGERVSALYVDELGELADPRKMGLGPKVEVLLQQMRYRGGSIVTAMQWPTWLPKPAWRETRHRWVFRVQSEEDRRYLGSILGDRRTVEPIMAKLSMHSFLYQHVPTGRLIVSKVKRR